MIFGGHLGFSTIIFLRHFFSNFVEIEEVSFRIYKPKGNLECGPAQPSLLIYIVLTDYRLPCGVKSSDKRKNIVVLSKL